MKVVVRVRVRVVTVMVMVKVRAEGSIARATLINDFVAVRARTSLFVRVCAHTLTHTLSLFVFGTRTFSYTQRHTHSHTLGPP